MKVVSSANGVMKLFFLICYHLMLLVMELQADSSSNSADTSEEDYEILTMVPRKWYSTDYDYFAGGTAQEESDSVPENENSFSVDGSSIPNTDMGTGPISSVFVTPFRTSIMRTNVHVGRNDNDDDDEEEEEEEEGEGEMEEEDSKNSDGGDGEENETDNEGNGGDNGRRPWTTMTPDGGERKLFPVLPSMGRHCFIPQTKPNLYPRTCQCNSPPPAFPQFPETLIPLAMPSQINRGKRRHGDCNILCICWILSFVGVVIGAVYKISKDRRTHF